MRIWVTHKTVKRKSLPSIGCSDFVREFFSKRELLIFENINLMLGLTLSAGVRRLASELAIPESTCKVILRKFRDAGLIEAGKKQRQRLSIRLTPLVEQLSGGVRNGKRHID